MSARRTASGNAPSSRPRTTSIVGGVRGVHHEESLLEGEDASLLDILDNVLTKGVVVTGDLVLGVADVDLVYLRVSAILCAADRVLGTRAKTRASAARARRSVAPRSIAGKIGR
jgi:hypothetical protein